MPLDAEVLSCGVQGDDIVIWARHTDATKMGARWIVVANTGDVVVGRDALRFIGTVTVEGIVWHVFEGAVSGG